jgi:hypothetical protein
MFITTSPAGAGSTVCFPLKHPRARTKQLILMQATNNKAINFNAGNECRFQSKEFKIYVKAGQSEETLTTCLKTI